MDTNPFVQLYINLPPGLQVVTAVYAFMLLIRLIDWILFRDKMASKYGLWGMRAKHPNSLFAWVLNHFIHGNWRHLWSNSLPFLVMATIIGLDDPQEFVVATAVIMVMVDLGIWLFEASNLPTVGASGLVTGYFGYILLSGFFTKDTASVIIALIVLALYYGLLRIVFIPQKGNISNVGHFFGFVGGVGAAWVWSLILQQQIV